MVIDSRTCLARPGVNWKQIPKGCYVLDGVVYDKATNQPVNELRQPAASAPAKPAPAKPTKPVPSRTAPVGSRELSAAIYADFGQAKLADALARGLTYCQVAAEHSAATEKAWREKVDFQKAEIARLEADLAKRERRANGKGVRMSRAGFKVSLGTKPTTPAA